MRVDRVHAAGADQTHEMQRATVLPSRGGSVDEHGFVKKLPSAIDCVDADEVLLHHPAGAEVQMPHLAVAHLPARQPNRLPRRRRAACAARAPRACPRSERSPCDRIAFSLRAVAPAIEDEEDDGRRA